MSVYYNENDKFAADWLAELIKDGLIPAGVIDTRSIEDVTPDDVREFTQAHFFAGIGVWALAAKLAGWPDDRPLWTGSCPCQPFSAAGKGGGFDDERHLWPAFFHLIGECGPASVVGEQVASKDGLAWLDLVQADMEGKAYAFGAVDTCAAGFGAPHIRQRLYWGGLADSDNAGLEGRRKSKRKRSAQQPARSRSVASRLDHAPGSRHVGPVENTESNSRDEARLRVSREGCGPSGLADANGEVQGGRGVQRPGEGPSSCARASCERLEGLRQACPGQPGPTNGKWGNADWLHCRDGKWRGVEPGTFPLADAGKFRNRVGLLRGSGNALNIAQAQGFLEALLAS